VVEARRRTRTEGHYTGFKVYLDDHRVETHTVDLGIAICNDVVGNPHGINGLDIQKRTLSPGTFSGRHEFFAAAEYFGYPYTNQPSSGLIDLDALPTQPMSVQNAALKVAAATNPSIASISMPNAILELRDLPQMLLSKGKRFAETRPSRRSKPSPLDQESSIVEGHFGWESLFRDAASLFGFAGQVDQRMKELTSLATGKGLKRKRTTWSVNSTVTVSDYPFQTAEASIYGTRTMSIGGKQWVTIVWRPTGVPVFTDPKKQLTEVRLLVHGWRINPSQVWDALPWSWLTDYFVPVGDFLAANANTIGVVADAVCVMTHRYSRTKDVVLSSGPFIATAGSASYEEKLRTGSVPLDFFEAQIPFLNGTQLSNLSSIAYNIGLGNAVKG